MEFSLNVDGFLSGMCNIGVGLALAGVGGLLFGQSPIPAALAVTFGIVVVATILVFKFSNRG